VYTPYTILFLGLL